MYIIKEKDVFIVKVIRRNKGFTLIEVLVTIAEIAILAANFI